MIRFADEVRVGDRVTVKDGGRVLPATVNGEPYDFGDAFMIPVHVQDGNRNLMAHSANVEFVEEEE